MSDPTIDLLKDLVAIDSVNPSLVPGGAGEENIAKRIAQELRSFGSDAVLQHAATGRPNVIGVIDSGRPGPSLMLCGHSDTVGIEGMSAPFDPQERDGRVYGRGAQDMKGGVASILGAAREVAGRNLLRAGKLVVAIVADEEYASIGAEALVKEWRTDAAVVCEPTDLDIGVGHKGFEWVSIVTEGVAAHGSRPEDGVDAITMMGRVLRGLEDLERSFLSRPHPLLGRPSLHASLITGGRELSTYPDRCQLQIERRTVDGEREGIALDEVEAILDRARAGDEKFRATAELMFTRKPYLTPEGHPLPVLLSDAIKPRRVRTAAMSFWTDAAVLGTVGTACAIFGPGGAGLHGVEEYVRINEVLDCRDALVQTATRFCNG